MTWLLRPIVAAAALAAIGCATVPKVAPETAASGETPEVPRPSKDAAKPQTPEAAFGASAVDAHRRGQTALAQGDLAGAERALREATSKAPKMDPAWADLGVVLERTGKVADAEQAYLKAGELNPNQPHAWEHLSRLYCRTGRAAQAEALLRQKAQAHPEALGIRNALVATLITGGQHEAAAAEAKKVLKADERNVRAMQLLAQVYYREQKFELAKMVLENARAISPSDAATHNALGLTQLALKAKPQALESFKQAAALQPDFAEARNNFGAMLNEAQDYEAAARELEAAVGAAPDFASARLNLGNAFRGQQQFDKALEQYRQVLQLRPAWADTYFNLAILHLDSEIPNLDTIERYKTAITYFEQYRAKGGSDDRIDQYLKDANKAIDKEERRRERAARDALKKAEKQRKEEEAKKAEEAKTAAEQPPSEGAPPPSAPAAPKGSEPAKSSPASPPTSAPGASAEKRGKEASAKAPSSGKLTAEGK